jgi:hypothetical protein
MADTDIRNFERSVVKIAVAWRRAAEQHARRWKDFHASAEGTKRKGAAATAPPGDANADQELRKIIADTNMKLAELERDLMVAVARMVLATEVVPEAPRLVADAVRTAAAPLAEHVTVAASVDVDAAHRRVRRIRLTPRWKS